MSLEMIASLPAVVLPRSQVSVPIAPVQTITDMILFENALEPSQTYYLPRYRIATESVSGDPQFRIALNKVEQGGKLQVVLEKFPAPGLETSARQAQELAHTLDARLQYIVSVGNAGRIRKELSFGEIETTPTGVRLTLTVADLNELTQLYQAMTGAAYESTLTIVRQINVGIPLGDLTSNQVSSALASQLFLPQRVALLQSPVLNIPVLAPIRPRPGRFDPLPSRPAPSKPASSEPILPNPDLRFVGIEEYEVRGERFKRFNLRVENWGAYPVELFAPAPDLPPCGANTNSSRTWVDILDAEGRKLYGFCAVRSAESLQRLWFAVPVSQTPPAAVAVALRDRRQNLLYRSQIVATHLGEGVTHALKLTVPTREKAPDDGYSFVDTQLRNISPGNTITLLVEFPDQPMIPLVGMVGEGQRTRMVVGNGASSAWMQTVEGQVTTDAEFAFVVDHIRLFAHPDGRLAGLEASVSTAPFPQPARVRSFTLTFRVPPTILGFPLTPNQTLPITVVRWQGLAVETEQFFHVGQETAVAQEPLPFVFDSTMHGYIYRDILVDPDQRFGLLDYQERWDEHDHFYFQDEAQRDVVYYLPDAFKLVRKARPPYTPDLLLFFDTTDDGAQATLYYRAVPVVEPARLVDAESKLKARLRDLPPHVARVTFKPLLSTDQIVYRLALPRNDSTLGPFQERAQAQVDLRNGIEDAVTLPMNDFRTVFDSLFSPGASLFNGYVEVTLNGVKLPAIPLIAKLYDLVGELLLIESGGERAGQQSVTFHNATESPLRINWLTAKYATDNHTVDAPITNLAFPTQVEAGGSVTFHVIKPTPIGTTATALVFNLAGVQVLPDPAGVWDAILDPVIRPEYRTTVEVNTTVGVFTRQAARAILIEFPGRTSVKLTPEQPTATATLYVPIRDYVLNKHVELSYRYRLQVVHETYITAHNDWQEFRGTIVPITDQQLPKGEGDVAPDNG